MGSRTEVTLGYLMGLSGLANIVQGWVLGSEGFPTTNTFAILAGCKDNFRDGASMDIGMLAYRNSTWPTLETRKPVSENADRLPGSWKHPRSSLSPDANSHDYVAFCNHRPARCGNDRPIIGR